MSRGQRTLLLLLLAASACLVMHTLVIGDGWARRRHAQQDLVALDTEVGGARERVASLRSQIDGLRQRSEVQEHVIRDELGYLRPGDVIVNVGEAASAR